MIILAVDYGDTRTGLARCDKAEMLAVPHSVITERNAARLAAKIDDEARKIGAELIVVGNPINMDGTKGSRSEKCTAFADELGAVTGLPVKMWDERSTTVSAAYYLNQTDVRGKKRKAVIDAVAAVIILESFLAARKNNSIN
jgi:putative Holliday junction resolvase